MDPPSIGHADYAVRWRWRDPVKPSELPANHADKATQPHHGRYNILADNALREAVERWRNGFVAIPW